jgi:hypothetical protein
MNQEDLQALRTPLLVLVLVLLAGGGAIYYSDRMTAGARLQLGQQQKQLKDARTRLQKSGDERDVIVRYLEGFRQLERSGFVGEEQRINWLDGLRLANQQADLFGVSYQIGTQSAYAYAAQYNPGQIALSQSVMKLDFRLLHEADLGRFFNALSRQRCCGPAPGRAGRPPSPSAPRWRRSRRSTGAWCVPAAPPASGRCRG